MNKQFSLQDFINYIQEKNMNMDAVMVIQNDHILGLHRFSDVMVHNVFSAAKSFLSTGIGMAIDEGLMTLEDKPVDYFADMLPEGMDEAWNQVTLRNLLTMTSGHGSAYMMSAERRILRGETEQKLPQEIMDEWLLYAFTRPMTFAPGETFYYSNLAPYVAGRMLEKAAGMPVNDYLDERLWKPLNIQKPQWETDLSGHTVSATGLYLDIVDMAKLGMIYLGQGEYRGKRYITKEWAKTATSNLLASDVINPAGYSDDEKRGYGYYFWQNTRGGYRAYGRDGQLILVLPEKNAVIATQGNEKDVQPIMEGIWEHIYTKL